MEGGAIILFQGVQPINALRNFGKRGHQVPFTEAIGAQERPFQHVAQFANIARKIMTSQS